MHYAYLVYDAVSLCVWFVLFWLRKDLRKMMLIMSIGGLPLALFDLVFVPLYWQPLTLYNLPIGLEGFLYSFTIGGIAAVLYAELTHRTLRHVRGWRIARKQSIWIPILTLATFAIADPFLVPNPEFAAYLALIIGIVAALYLRKSLMANVIWGSICFGIVYTLSLKLWIFGFRDVHSWFTFQEMPKLFIWGIPGWEAVFGFFFGGFWGILYEVLFGYSLVPSKSMKTRRDSPASI